MSYTIVPITSTAPLTLSAEYLALDGAAAEAWKKALQALHPRLLPQLKESALLSEDDSEFCAAGGIFDYQRGQELVIDGVQYTLSHCAAHFFDFLLSPAQCLQVVREQQEALLHVNRTAEEQARFARICSWWEQGQQVLLLQHR